MKSSYTFNHLMENKGVNGKKDLPYRYSSLVKFVLCEIGTCISTFGNQLVQIHVYHLCTCEKPNITSIHKLINIHFTWLSLSCISILIQNVMPPLRYEISGHIQHHHNPSTHTNTHTHAYDMRAHQSKMVHLKTKVHQYCIFGDRDREMEKKRREE